MNALDLPLSRMPASAMRPGVGKLRPSVHLCRAVFARARRSANRLSGESAEDIAKNLWPGDEVTSLILRGATSPANRVTSGWASQLAVAAVGDFISSLQPLSAGARVLDAAVQVSLDGVNTLAFPYRSGPIDPLAAPWVPEGGVIPVAQFSLTSATLGPAHKLAIITSLTRETAEYGDGERVLTQLLKENAAAALDSSLFSNVAATADRPPGLLAGVAALPAAAAGAGAMAADLAAIAGAIGTVTTNLVYVAHPAQARAIQLQHVGPFPADIPIWATIGVPEGTVIGLDPAALATGFSSEPEISTSKETVVHMESATPLPIGSPGSPNTIAAPSRSFFQTDVIGIRLILRCAWAWRVPGAAAWIQNTNW